MEFKNRKNFQGDKFKSKCKVNFHNANKQQYNVRNGLKNPTFIVLGYKIKSRQNRNTWNIDWTYIIYNKWRVFDETEWSGLPDFDKFVVEHFV